MKKSEVIDQTKAILEEYTTRLTLRQIFYRLVSKHTIGNTTNNYKYLSKLLVQARLEGQIPFDAIEDRTRKFVGGDNKLHTPKAHYDGWLKAFRESHEYHELPMWLNQNTIVEVWVEKEALSGLFGEITDDRNVTLATCRGYPSLTFMYQAAQRLEDVEEDIFILYFGDYDPSGEDIYRHIQDTFVTFDVDADFEKVAITREQIDRYDIPPMPAKKSDARAANFIAQHGDIAVELDAIEPTTLQNIIAAAIDKHFDNDTYDETVKRQDREQKKIKKMIEDLLGEEKEN